MSHTQILITKCSHAEREAAYAAALVTACADGTLGRREQRMLARVRRELDLPRSVHDRLMAGVRDRTLKVRVPAAPSPRRLMFHYVLRLAGADGRLAETERCVAEHVANWLRMDPLKLSAELKRVEIDPEPDGLP